MIINKDIANESTKLSRNILRAEAEQKLLGAIIDNALNFQSHTKSIIKTANQNLSAFIRAALFMNDFKKKNVIFNSLLKATAIIVSYSGYLALEL